MRFGTIAVAEAQGAILAHSLKLSTKSFKKGRILSAEDLDLLHEAGIDSVIAAQLEPDDVHEDQAAGQLAEAVQGSGIRAGAAFTGRCNLFAREAGLLQLDIPRLNQLNRVHEALTLATLPDEAMVVAKQMLATVKIIPFAAPRQALAQTLAIAAEPLLWVAPFRARRVGIIQTELPGSKARVLDKTQQVLANRLGPLQGELLDEIRCPHQEAAVAQALQQQLAAGAELVLIVGASAIVDRRDVLPAGIQRAGGTVDHYGMPVDPGNLLLLAHHGKVPVLGLPGCARSPKFNGVDQVLRRLCADLPVTPAHIMGMGVGGLLQEIPERPLPRADAPIATQVPHAPSIAALVLAAGQSRRMGKRNKLLAEVDGEAMVNRAVQSAREAGCEPVMVVTGHEREQVVATLGEQPVSLVHNPDYAEGLSTSLATGLGALPEHVDGVVVLLGDMPRVNHQVLERLIAAFDPVEGRAICVPTFNGKRGNPVLWSRRLFAEMGQVKGDVGARHLIGEHAELVCEVPMPDDGVLMDVDTPEVLAGLADR